MKPGSWLVLTIVLSALVLALVALKLRAPMPKRIVPPPTGPVTLPSTSPSSDPSPRPRS
jgi:hypothetical protein